MCCSCSLTPIESGSCTPSCRWNRWMYRVCTRTENMILNKKENKCASFEACVRSMWILQSSTCLHHRSSSNSTGPLTAEHLMSNPVFSVDTLYVVGGTLLFCLRSCFEKTCSMLGWMIWWRQVNIGQKHPKVIQPFRIVIVWNSSKFDLIRNSQIDIFEYLDAMLPVMCSDHDSLIWPGRNSKSYGRQCPWIQHLCQELLSLLWLGDSNFEISHCDIYGIWWFPHMVQWHTCISM